MGPTETRSHGEWLAEAKRRGTRLRRRRRLVIGTLAALGLVLPASALTTLAASGPGPAVEMSVAGPAPTGAVAGSGPAESTSTSAPAAATEAPGATATGAGDPPAAATTTAPSPRADAARGRPAPPEPTTTLPAADDPVDRRPGATNPVLPDPGTSVSSSLPRAAANTPATTEPDLASCPASTVGVTVVTAKAAYATGDKVEGSSTLENRGPTACLLPTRAFFRVLNAAGDDVGGFAHTMEFRLPVRAEPGATITSTFAWDQRDCTGSTCAQVPPGTYTVVADWSESGPYSGRTTFRVDP